MSNETLAIKDPMGPQPLGWLGQILNRFINDPRDVPFVRLLIGLSLCLPPVALYLFLPGRFRWWIAVPYLMVELYFIGPFTLMLHNTSHRRLFKKEYGALNRWIPWGLGPFFGQSPETYFAHHVGMHHPEENLWEDLSTTMPYQRDSAVDFARYFLRFFAFGLIELSAYFVRTRRKALLRRTLLGELTYYAVMAISLAANWRAALTVFVIPFLTTRFVMMAGNWAQHAFIDADTPESSYRSSITCINSVYNRRCFNDGYHIGHHLEPTRHWTEMPGELLANKSRYIQSDAIVFEGLDYFVIWALLMGKRYEALARRVVYLGGPQKTTDEIVGLLKSRTRRFEAKGELRPRVAA